MPRDPAAATSHLRLLLSAAFEGDTVIRALKVAAVVGTLLVAINQGDVLLRGEMPPRWKLVLTYLVPYCVSAYSAAAFQVADRARSGSG